MSGDYLRFIELLIAIVLGLRATTGGGLRKRRMLMRPKH